MKYLIIIVISIFCLFNQNGTKKVYLQPTNDQITLTQINEAAQIMVDRLNAINIDASFEINSAAKSIAITSKSDLLEARATKLITQVGHLAFMEGRPRHVFFRAIDRHDPLFTLIDTSRLTSDLPRIQEEVVGTFTETYLKKVLVEIQRINHSDFSKKTTLHYALGDDGEDAKLFLLASTEKNDRVLREDISRVSVDGSVTDALVLNMEFSGKGGEKFASFTGQNVNHLVAIVLDKEVLIAPRVNEAITGGKISITGNFSKEEASFYHAMLQGPELPCAFLLK